MYLLEDEPHEFDNECDRVLKLEPTFKLPLRDAKLVLDKRDETNGMLVCKPKDHRSVVANSCNGLLCLCDPINKDPLIVCNPITSEFIRLPKVTLTPKKTQRPICSGIGFHPKTNEYKVIRMWNNYYDNNVFQGIAVEIHKVGTSTWRNVRVDRSILAWRLEHPTFLNGSLHWILFDSSSWSILRFNFETENLKFFPSPSFKHNGLPIPHKEGVSMGALGDSLYVCYVSLVGSVKVWIMKKYGSKKSWTKVFSYHSFGAPRRDISLCWPVIHFEKVIALLEYHSEEGFTYYKPEKHRLKRFLVCGTKAKLLEVIPHIPSLISLKDIVKGDNIEVLNVHSR
jgi:F-box interacting protein